MQRWKTIIVRLAVVALSVVALSIAGSAVADAQATLPSVTIGMDQVENADDFVVTIQILALLTVLTLAPSILIMMTCFTRIIIVFHFLKQALATHTQPPAQVLVGLALFLTFFVMSPVLDEANANGLQPYLNEEIT